jgi:predicted lipid-binding transport protein (Tim44 family)
MINIQFKVLNFFLIMVFLAVPFFLATDSAEARRMGFGRSIGKPPPIKRQAIPPSQGVNKSIDKTPTKASNAANNKTRGFMGPLAGLAAGLGLAALASHLGVGAELMGFLLILLAAAAIFFVVRLFLRNMQSSPSLEGVGPSFNREITGNKIDTKPQAASKKNNVSGKMISQDEIDAFLENSKKQFVEIQKIWDSGSIDNLKFFCTDGLVLELSDQIKEKINEGSKTSISKLSAVWEGMDFYVTEEGFEMEEVYVLFSGMVRENKNGLSNEFSEIWTLQRLKSSDDGWLVAGITQTN